MSVISNKNVNEIIRNTLSVINRKIMEHGEFTGYILYKMLEFENQYTQQQLADYTMIGILHDIGLYKEENVSNIVDFETKNQWPHSVYGHLFIKYLSPLGSLADIILYHHLDYNYYPKVSMKYQHITECLNLADKMHTFVHMKEEKMEPDYFIRYRNIKFSGQAMDLFRRAQAHYDILGKMRDGTYKTELATLLGKKVCSEEYKRRFLEMLVYMIDFRSEHTVVHTISTVNFAQQLGRMMRLSATDMNNLYYGALLHDIGKIAIPLSILESPGRLNDEDMRVMKGHVQITEILLQGKVAQEVVDIAARHHEKLDGSGYHRGLTEKDLTLPQKIVAVADILSALYGKRSYKDSFDSSLIRVIMTEDAANHKISQEVTTCLLNNYDRIIANYEKEKQNTLGIYFMIKEQYEMYLKKFESIKL